MDADKERLKKPKTLDGQQLRAAHYLARNGYKYKSGRKNGAITGACRAVGCGRDLLYKWLTWPEFVEEIEAYNAKLNDLWGEGVETALAGKIIENTTTEERLTRNGDIVTTTKVERQFIPPNASVLIWWGKTQRETLDENLRRDKARHKHDEAMIRLKAALGVEDDKRTAPPVIIFGERPPSLN